jgi:hypothetical protein
MELVWDGDRRRERGNRCDAAQATEIDTLPSTECS